MAQIKHVFESGSTFLLIIAIVQVFDEHVYDRKGNVMSTLTVAASQEVGRRPRLEIVRDEPRARVYDIQNAPSARKRRQVLREEDPSMRRHPVVGVRPQANFRHLVTVGLSFIAATGIAIGAGLALQSSPYDGPTRIVSVSSGDSVWSLAQGVQTSRPLKDVVTDIKELNNVNGALQVGQEIRVPTR